MKVYEIRSDEIEDHYLVYLSQGSFLHLVKRIGEIKTVCGKHIGMCEGFIKGRKEWLEHYIHSLAFCMSCTRIYDSREDRGGFQFSYMMDQYKRQFRD